MQANNQNLYQCKECGLHYKDKDTAEKCETWCKEHKTCNVEITREAEENMENPSSSADSPEQVQKDLEECGEKCDEYLNNWKRAQADFENYKKEEIERITALMQYNKEGMIEKILPIFDNIHLAEKNLFTNQPPSFGTTGVPAGPACELVNEKSYVGWKGGFLQIKKQIEEFLKKEGIEEIKTVGEKFNPETMEAIDEISNSQFPISNMVVEEVQRGYTLNGKVIRPAKIRIAK